MTKPTSTSAFNLPCLAITTGEPAGIGPDICLALACEQQSCEWVFVGDINFLRKRAAILNLELTLQPWNERLNKAAPTHHMYVCHTPLAEECEPGRLNVANASYVLETLNLATDGCLHQLFDAMVTAPVNKAVINDSGIPFSGHTEYLCERCDVESVVMMLANQQARVALVTTHIPLTQVSSAITSQRLKQVTGILEHDLITRFNISTPNILVCGLNPHAGESGHMGSEETITIEPFVASYTGCSQLVGPLPADTIFTPHNLSQADVILAMYHDQGLAPLKAIGFGETVNITLGLPIIRTSVDHGTALDIAAIGTADNRSLQFAIKTALELCRDTTHG